jgi:hypothetical protein
MDGREVAAAPRPQTGGKPASLFKTGTTPVPLGSKGENRDMPAETVRIMCPNLTCRKVLAVPENARGKTVRCKGCGTNIRVPPPKSSAKTDQQKPHAA